MSETLQLRPNSFFFNPGTAPCSGSYAAVRLRPTAGAIFERDCFSGLSFPGVLVFTNFETPPRPPTRAVITVVGSGSRPDVYADDGTFLSGGTYNGVFHIFWRYGTPGIDHTLRFNNAAYSAADTWVLPDSFLPIPTNWTQLLVAVTIQGSVTSAFSFVDYKGKRYYTATNLLAIDDIHVEVTIPSPGISFSSTHGSGGGDGIGGASLAI
jgi:hypothetical protein